MISGFTTTTNSFKMCYPIIEAIKSYLPVLDELIVIDGGSTDGTLEAIKELNDSRIRIICDEDTKWEKDWKYSRMNHNMDRGFRECQGDIVLKFDADRILKDKDLMKQDLQRLKNERYLDLRTSRYSIKLIDRYGLKKPIMRAVNRNVAKDMNLNLRYGLDLEIGAHNNFIDFKEEKDGILWGKMLHFFDKNLDSQAKEFDYGYCFTDKRTAARTYYRHTWALQKQFSKQPKFTSYKDSFEHYVRSIGNLEELETQTRIKLEEHPEEMQDKIKNMTEAMKGRSLWGMVKTNYDFYR